MNYFIFLFSIVILSLSTQSSSAVPCNQLIKDSVLVIETNTQCFFEKGTVIVHLHELDIRSNGKLLINTDVPEVELTIGTLKAANNALIDASSTEIRVAGAQGTTEPQRDNDANALVGLQGGKGKDGLKGGNALSLLTITAGLGKIDHLTIKSNGGVGGVGGKGGKGGLGSGVVCRLFSAYDAGKGGQGGQGGQGGNGGPGGDAGQVIFKWFPRAPMDTNSTEFPGSISIITRGGQGGGKGPAGDGSDAQASHTCWFFLDDAKGAAEGPKGLVGEREGLPGQNAKPRQLRITEDGKVFKQTL